MNHSVPSHDTFTRVFSLIDMDQVEHVLGFFVSPSLQKLSKALKIPAPAMKQICVDGIVPRGSGSSGRLNRSIGCWMCCSMTMQT